MDRIWSDLESELHRFVRRLALEAIPYPAVILLATAAGATLLARRFPEAFATWTIVQDLWWGLTGIMLLTLPLADRYRLFRLRQEWYRAFARVAHGLDRRSGLVHALEYAARAGSGSLQDALLEAAGACASGTEPAEALRIHGCPGEICRCIARGTSEPDAVIRLRAAFTARATRLRHRIAPAERVGPAAAITATGLVLLWVVVRLVLPVLEILYSGGAHA